MVWELPCNRCVVDTDFNPKNGQNAPRKLSGGAPVAPLPKLSLRSGQKKPPRKRSSNNTGRLLECSGNIPRYQMCCTYTYVSGTKCVGPFWDCSQNMPGTVQDCSRNVSWVVFFGRNVVHVIIIIIYIYIYIYFIYIYIY